VLDPEDYTHIEQKGIFLALAISFRATEINNRKQGIMKEELR